MVIMSDCLSEDRGSIPRSVAINPHYIKSICSLIYFKDISIIGVSFSGRTLDFDSRNDGSIPSTPTIHI